MSGKAGPLVQELHDCKYVRNNFCLQSVRRCYRWCSARAVEEADLPKEGPVGAGNLVSAHLLARLFTKNVKDMADLVRGIALNIFELVTAGVNQRGGQRSRDCHLTIWFVGASGSEVFLTGAE